MFIDGEGSCTGGSCNGGAGEEKKEGSCSGEAGSCDGSHQA